MDRSQTTLNSGRTTNKRRKNASKRRNFRLELQATYLMGGLAAAAAAGAGWAAFGASFFPRGLSLACPDPICNGRSQVGFFFWKRPASCTRPRMSELGS